VSAPTPLLGRRVLVTREEPGRLASLLEERGAIVVHVPLISVIEAADGGAELRANLDRLDEFDWLVVTSPAGASRVGDAARHHPAVRLAAVGARTAAVLASAADRPVDLVPDDQHGAALAESLAVQSPAQLLLAVADRAPTTLAASLVAAGHSVTTVTAYQTISAPAGPDDADVIDTDALLLASGSTAEAWVERFGVSHPPVVVAIGAATATVAARVGLKVSGVATDHSLTGLVIELERCLNSSAGAE
jgi:uroporphyrinogen-III synthase